MEVGCESLEGEEEEVVKVCGELFSGYGGEVIGRLENLEVKVVVCWVSEVPPLSSKERVPLSVTASSPVIRATTEGGLIFCTAFSKIGVSDSTECKILMADFSRFFAPKLIASSFIPVHSLKTPEFFKSSGPDIIISSFRKIPNPQLPSKPEPVSYLKFFFLVSSEMEISSIKGVSSSFPNVGEDSIPEAVGVDVFGER